MTEFANSIHPLMRVWHTNITIVQKSVRTLTEYHITAALISQFPIIDLNLLQFYFYFIWTLMTFFSTMVIYVSLKQDHTRCLLEPYEMSFPTMESAPRVSWFERKHHGALLLQRYINQNWCKRQAASPTPRTTVICRSNHLVSAVVYGFPGHLHTHERAIIWRPNSTHWPATDWQSALYCSFPYYASSTHQCSCSSNTFLATYFEYWSLYLTLWLCVSLLGICDI